MKRLYTYIFLLNKKNIFSSGINGSYIDTGPFYSLINYRKDGVYE